MCWGRELHGGLFHWHGIELRLLKGHFIVTTVLHKRASPQCNVKSSFSYVKLWDVDLVAKWLKSKDSNISFLFCNYLPFGVNVWIVQCNRYLQQSMCHCSDMIIIRSPSILSLPSLQKTLTLSSSPYGSVIYWIMRQLQLKMEMSRAPEVAIQHHIFFTNSILYLLSPQQVLFVVSRAEDAEPHSARRKLKSVEQIIKIPLVLVDSKT